MAVDKGTIPASYIAQYVQHMHDMECTTAATDLSPQDPSIDQLNYGGLVNANKALRLSPPEDDSTDEVDRARNDIKGLHPDAAIKLTRYLYGTDYADLQWLYKMCPLGAGSVVRYGEAKLVEVIKRPEVFYDHVKPSKNAVKMLAYRTVGGNLVRATFITEVLVHTEWPMGELPILPNLDIPDKL